jgi:uncharacterized membrane protein YadS
LTAKTHVRAERPDHLPPGTGVLKPGAFASRQVLQASIVVLGTGLSLAQVANTGPSSLPVMLGKLARTLMIIPICLGQAFWQARRHRRRAASGVTMEAPAVPWRRMFPWFIVCISSLLLQLLTGQP